MVRCLLLGIALLFSVVVAGSPAASSLSSVHAAPAAYTARPLQAPATERAAFLDTLRVVGHLALAYGAFHHFVYNPWNYGEISLRHPIKLTEAGAALLFAAHEVKKAYAITSKARSGPLHAVNSLLGTISNQFTSIGTQFHTHPASLTDGQVGNSISNLNDLVNQSNRLIKVPDAPVSKLPSSF